MIRERDTMLKGARSAIRNGRTTEFWTARWVDRGIRLIELVDDPDAEINTEDMVSDFVDSDGCWDVNRLTSCLPAEAVDMVVGMTLPCDDRGEDQWVWGGENHGQFSIKSAYKLIHDCADPSSTDPWMTIWNWKGPNRVRFFLWLAVQDKLLTNGSRVRRHMTTDGSCPICHAAEETTIHVLRDCTFAKDVWKHVRGAEANHRDGQLPLTEWMCNCLRTGEGVLFGVIC
ncbi:Putative ribonuclease H protein At1g65750 [Linum perenne]